MKLVVDVPEGNYKALKKMSGCCGLGVYHEMILNGIPLSEELEKIKAEIELMDFDFGDYYDHTDTIIEMVSKVIDNYISELKGE